MIHCGVYFKTICKCFNRHRCAFAALMEQTLGCRVYGPSPNARTNFPACSGTETKGDLNKTRLHFCRPHVSWCPVPSRLPLISLLSNYALGFSNFTESNKSLDVAPAPQPSQ